MSDKAEDGVLFLEDGSLSDSEVDFERETVGGNMVETVLRVESLGIEQSGSENLN
jgi:hypothetical protein